MHAMVVKKVCIIADDKQSIFLTFLDPKINGVNPVKKGCIVSEKSDPKSVCRIIAYTATTTLSFNFSDNI